RLKVAEAAVAPATKLEDAPQGSPSPPASTSAAVPRESRLTQRRGLAVAGLALTLALGTVGTWWFWPKHPHITTTTTSPPPAPVNSVAVLPFANLSGDPKLEYFSDGFSEELLNELASNPHLRVPGNTSSFALKGKHTDVSTIARMLGVRS